MTEIEGADTPFWIYVLRTLLDRRDMDRKMAAAMGTVLDTERMQYPEALVATYQDDDILGALQTMKRADNPRIIRVLRDELARRGISAEV